MGDTNRAASSDYDSEEVNAPHPKNNRHEKRSDAQPKSSKGPSDSGSAKRLRHRAASVVSQEIAIRDVRSTVQTPNCRPNPIQSPSSRLTTPGLSTGGRTKSPLDTGYFSSSPPDPSTSDSRWPSKQSAFESELPELLEDFAAIETGDYKTCYTFVKKYPDVCDHDEKLFLRDAVAALVAKRESHAKRCVQRAVMVQQCAERSSSGIRIFFEGLINKKTGPLDEFLKNCHDATVKIRILAASAASPDRLPLQDPIPAAPFGSMSLKGDNSRSMGEWNSISQPSATTLRTHKDVPMPFSTRTETQRHLNEQRPADQFSGSAARTHQDVHTQRGNNSAYSTSVVTGDRAAPAAEGRSARRQGASDGPTVPDDDIRRTKVALHTDYEVKLKSNTFFTFGRVFATPWHTTLGAQQANHLHSELRDWVVIDCLGLSVLTHIQRMVVVKEGHGYSWCLFINTYSGRGVAKTGLSSTDRFAHSVIHMTGTPARTTSDEKNMMRKRSITVNAASLDQKLNAMSRINFSKVHTIEHNLKVMDVGTISKESLNNFSNYWKEYR